MEAIREIGSGDQNRLFFYPKTPLCGQLDLVETRGGNLLGLAKAVRKSLEAKTDEL